MNPDKVTIIILNWKQAEATIDCLQSLSEADLGGAAILSVDNGSNDGSIEKIRARFPDQVIIGLSENCGYAGGNNAGIRIALQQGAEGVLLLNNDTRVLPDFLSPLLAALDTEVPVAAVSSAVMRMDRPEMLDVAYGSVDFTKLDSVRINGVNALPGEGFDRRKMIEVAVGCSVLLTAEALKEVGLLDEGYFAYHEDVDWCLRARGAGYFILYEPASRVLHHGARSTRAIDEAPARGVSEGAQLPNAEPLPWNPVQSYLGGRNLVRIVSAYADAEQKKAFRRALAFELPLKFLAILEDREGRLKLGRWGYKDFLRQHFVAPHEVLRRRSGSMVDTARRILASIVLFPFGLFVGLPVAWWRAFRQGRLAEFAEYLRGLRDGVLGRPIPFERLGLR